VVPEKRKLMVVSGAILAAFALPGCAPAGYNAADYGSGAAGAAEPAANAVEATPTAEASDAADNSDQKTDKKDAPELTDKELTNELNGTTVARMGDVVEDENGWVLYRFDKDKVKPSKSTCVDTCAKIWPPALTDGEPKLKGIDADKVGTVDRADGTKQITIGGWPVYRYIGDLKPGTWKGQNVGGTWFVVKPDGTKNLTCLPKISKPVAPPADDSAEKGSESDSSGSSGSSGGEYNY
jgi:predicted lipoprotein with Yx(FWY)xxD motif